MKYFILTSTKFEGSIEYKYCDAGYLTFFRYSAVMTDQQRDYTLEHMPLTIAGFNKLLGSSKTVKIEEVTEDISFEAFWEAYDNKINKKRCLPLYEKLSDAKRLQCVRGIAKYERYLKKLNWRTKADPESFLRKEMWLTDWLSIK